MDRCCSEAEKYGRRCRISGSSRSFAANVSFPGLDLQNAKRTHQNDRIAWYYHWPWAQQVRTGRFSANSITSSQTDGRTASEGTSMVIVPFLRIFFVFGILLQMVTTCDNTSNQSLDASNPFSPIATRKAASTPRSLASALLCPTQQERGTEKLEETLLKRFRDQEILLVHDEIIRLHI